MEIITIEVQTQAQVEMILAKIKEVGNEEMTITTKHSPKKRAITKVAKEKSKGKSIKPITDSEKKFVASMEKSMKEIAQIEAGKKKPTKAKDFLKKFHAYFVLLSKFSTLLLRFSMVWISFSIGWLKAS